MPWESVLSPLDIGAVTVRNRVATTAHMTGYAADGMVTDTLVDYLAARARGGVGMIVTEAGAVHPTYRPASYRLDREGVGPGLERLATAVHAAGAVLIGQLNHGGAASPALQEGVPQYSASDNDGMNGAPARAMTLDEIAEFQDAFVRAAGVLSDAGLDGTELHGAHHYLINHFLSPLYNRREDRYGGDAEGRLRFVAEILARIRETARPGFVLGVRLNVDLGPGGLDAEGLVAVGTALAERGLVDYVGFSLGGRTPESFPLMVGAMDRPAGYELAWNEVPSRGLPVPTMVTGRFRTLDEADAVVASGAADLVGMTRAHIADPEIVRKSRAGQVARIRPCIGCNECQRAIITQGALRCAVNPALPAPGGTDDVPRAAVARRVAMLGGGPAGLEAARTAALAGHRVTLWEATDALGGQALRAARTIPHAAGTADGIGWTIREIDRLGVDVRLGALAERDAVLAEDPELLIVATGSTPRRGARQTARPGLDVPGGHLPHVVPAQAVLDESVAPATAVVVDELGEQQALGVCELLVSRGAHVVLVTPFAAVALPTEATGRPSTALGRLRASGRFEARTLSMVTAVDAAHVEIEDLLGHGVARAPAALLVMVVRAAPHRPSWVSDVDVPVEFVGDALLPRSYRTAVREGHGAAVRIEESVRPRGRSRAAIA